MSESVENSVKAIATSVILQAAIIGGFGLFVGCGVTLVALFLGKDAERTADIIVQGYTSLLLFLPISSWLAHLVAIDEDDAKIIYSSLTSALLTSICGAILGVTFGGGLGFLVSGIHLPIVLRGFNANQFSLMVREQIYWNQFLLVLAVVVGVTVPLAIWTWRRAKDDKEISIL